MKSVPEPSGLADGVESTGAPTWAGHPPTPDPFDRWKAYTPPARSPTTTEGPPPSRVATLGELWAIGEPPSGRTCCQAREIPRACGVTAAPAGAPSTTARVGTIPAASVASTVAPARADRRRPPPRTVQRLRVG